MNKEIILGNRVPYEYFITSGTGESDVGSEGLPYETGSYDEALTNAGIQNANIIEYTSVIPTEAKEIPKLEGLERIQWGEVLECIKAQTNGAKGKFISAAVMTTTVIDPQGRYLGGFAVEYSGSGDRKSAEKSMEDSITGIVERRNFGNIEGGAKLYKDNKTDKGFIIHPGKIFVYEGMKVKRDHGTVLSTICFVSYKFPLLKSASERKMSKTRKSIKNSNKRHNN